MDMDFIEDIAPALYDGGWRADDRDDLKETYAFTNEEVEAICKLLAEYERRGIDNE